MSPFYLDRWTLDHNNKTGILLFTCMWFLGPKRYQTFLAVNLKSLGCEPVKEIKIRAVRFLKYQLYPFTPLDCISDTTSFLLDQGVVRKLIHALFAAVLNWLAWSATQELCFQRPPVLETRSPSQVVEQISFLLPWSICLSCCCCGCHSLIYCASFFRVPSNNKRARSGARGGARKSHASVCNLAIVVLGEFKGLGVISHAGMRAWPVCGPRSSVEAAILQT